MSCVSVRACGVCVCVCVRFARAAGEKQNESKGEGRGKRGVKVIVHKLAVNCAS